MSVHLRLFPFCQENQGGCSSISRGTGSCDWTVPYNKNNNNNNDTHLYSISNLTKEMSAEIHDKRLLGFGGVFGDLYLIQQQQPSSVQRN